MICAIISFPSIGFDVGYGRDLQLIFVELTVFVQFYELDERFLAILVLDFDVQVVKPDHPVPFGFRVDVCGDI